MGRKNKSAGHTSAVLATALLDLGAKIDSVVDRLSQQPDVADHGDVRDAARGLRRRLARLDDVVTRIEGGAWSKSSASPSPPITEPQREALGELRERLARLDGIMTGIAAAMPLSDARTEWESRLIRSVGPALARAESLLGLNRAEEVQAADGAFPHGGERLVRDARSEAAAAELLGQWTPASLREVVISLCDVFDAEGVDSNGHGAIALLLQDAHRLAGVQPFAPNGGDRIDPVRHEFEPTGRRSPHARGTVARVVRQGYECGGQVVRRARIEVSAGA